jgi:pyruvate dehydrogenase E2 component (dihydrolipoamide acetyltransferase)
LKVATGHGELYACRWKPAAAIDAPTMVLIHGLFGDTDTWAGTIASATRAGLSVLAIDLPCHGRSAAAVTRFADIVDAVAQAIAKLCEGPVALVGHSLGAAVAVKLARQPNLQVGSLTLFAPVGLGTEINQSFLDGMNYARSQEALEREMGKLTAARTLPSAAYLQKLRQRLAARAEQLAALCSEVSCHGVQQIHVRPDLDALKCPVAIVHGRSDAIIPWQHALNAPPRAALHLVPDAGHMPQAEALVLASEIIERSAAGAQGQP